MAFKIGDLVNYSNEVMSVSAVVTNVAVKDIYKNKKSDHPIPTMSYTIKYFEYGMVCILDNLEDFDLTLIEENE